MLTLPWFPPELHPNKRHHFHSKAPVYRAAKETAYVHARHHVSKVFGMKTIPLRLTFFPPDNCNRDLDNCLAACKAYCDGIAEAWGVNDTIFRPITIDFGEKVKGGEILVEVMS